MHGDLKPTNVLIFPTRTNRPMAKLADFGLSVDDLESSNLGGAGLGGTPGWQAPEVVEDRALTVEKLFKADNYSFGLLVWHFMLGLEGNAVPPCPSGTPQDIWIDNGIAKSQYPSDRGAVQYIIRTLLMSLLHHVPAKRPDRVGRLLMPYGSITLHVKSTLYVFPLLLNAQ